MVNDEEALLELLRLLAPRGYQFICVTPTTHEHVLKRPLAGPPTLRDIFGWNRSFTPKDLPGEILDLMEKGALIEDEGGRLRSKVRVASLEDRLFLHSAFPTKALDSVFFGPDTYRFARFVSQKLPDIGETEWMVDMGAGSGAGAISVGGQLPETRISLVDINSEALKLARVNARFAGVEAETIASDRVPRGCDLVISNPPYLMDAAHRTYRDGGGLFGGELALDWTRQSLSALRPGGTMILYTGAAFAYGHAPLVKEIASLCRSTNSSLQVEEIDPDVFGEELEREEYRSVERIAAIGMVIRSDHG